MNKYVGQQARSRLNATNRSLKWLWQITFLFVVFTPMTYTYAGEYTGSIGGIVLPSTPTQNTSYTTLFSEQFSGSQLNLSNWTVTTDYNTTGNEYSLQNGKLRVSLAGGTDGYMGKSMVLSFYPKYNLQSNDVSIRTTMTEISRNKVDGYKDNSAGNLCLNRDDSFLCIGIHGNYSGYHPDPTSGIGYNIYVGHRIATYVVGGGRVTYYKEVQLNLSTLYSYDFKIYNNNGIWATAYKDVNSSNWNTFNMSAFAPSSIVGYKPYLQTHTGDGGDTRKTGSIVMDFSNFAIEGSTPNVALTVNQPSNGEVTATGIVCGNDCTESYPKNTPITLTAKSAQGFIVDNWTGCVASADKQTCQVVMDAAKTVGVTFKSTVVSPPTTLPAFSPQCVAYQAEYSLKTKTLTLPIVTLSSTTSLMNVPTGKTELLKVVMPLAYKSETQFRVGSFEVVTGTIQLKPECPVPTYVATEERAYVPAIAIPITVTLGGKTIETGKAFYQATLKWLSTTGLFEIETVKPLQ